MRSLGLAVVSVLLSSAAAKIVTEPVTYQDGEVTLVGYLAVDDATTGRLPGVLVVPEWWGLNEFAREKARELAALGYVALAADMYGDGQSTEDPNEAGKLAGRFRDNVALWRRRAKAGLDALARQSRVDPARIGAIGFCFGGTTVLNMATAGLDLAAVVSFHGSLPPIREEELAQIKARILILHGAADTLVPDAALQGFQESLRKSKVDWQIVIFGGAKHSFTNLAAGDGTRGGVGYDERAARRAWQQMRVFLDEAFGNAPPPC